MNSAIRSTLRRMAVLSSISLLIFLLGLNSGLVERFYTNGLYQFTSVAQRFISSFFPFAIGDFLYVIFIIYCLWVAFKFIKQLLNADERKDARFTVSLKLVNFLLILYIVFKILWGLNYSRPSITGRLGLSNEKYTAKELLSLADFLITRTNEIEAKLETQKLKRKYTIRELQAGAKTSYDQLAKVNPFFKYQIPAVKPVLFSWAITKIGLEGYYNPLSGEANLNMRLPGTVLPFTTCHEISHELAVAREDEANLIGYLVSINSADLNFQYSGYYNILRSVLFEIRFKSPEDTPRLYKKINKATLADFKAERDFWMKYNSDMFGYMDVALDSFLKINNQQKGTDSYQDIVLWVYNLHRKELK